MRKPLHLLACLAAVLFLVQSCAKYEKTAMQDSKAAPTEAFSGYSIEDSSAIITYASGLQIYKVLDGPGKFPRDGMNIRMNYHGMLKDGSTFDSTFLRDEPFEFKLGQTAVITGLAEAVKKMRLGSKAVVMLPPNLGYGDKKDRPSNIPANSALIFHVELLGSF